MKTVSCKEDKYWMEQGSSWISFLEIVLTQLFADFRLPPRPSECSTAASKEGTDGEKQESYFYNF